MRWGRSIRWINALMVCGALVGCRSPKTIHYLGEADLQHYKAKSLAVEYSNADQPTPQEVAYSLKPHTLRDRTNDDIWDLSLMEAIQTALTNNKLIRTRANPQLSQNSPSIYDPALRETGFLFGNRGVEAALADFDANVPPIRQSGRFGTCHWQHGANARSYVCVALGQQPELGSSPVPNLDRHSCCGSRWTGAAQPCTEFQRAEFCRLLSQVHLNKQRQRLHPHSR